LAKSSRRRRIAALAHPLSKLGRDIGIAAMVFHNSVAAKLGLNPTDHRCLEMLHSAGVIDRLERAGFVRREAHPTDRRKVVVQTIPERFQEVSRLFLPLAQGMAALCEQYSDAELKVIMDYMTRSAELFRRETKRLRSDDAAASGKSD
jgi:hypothetical protein